jgi:hypothetical protein
MRPDFLAARVRRIFATRPADIRFRRVSPMSLAGLLGSRGLYASGRSWFAEITGVRTRP